MGWNPPEPLLEVSIWPAPSMGQAAVVPLDFYAVVGGPYRAAVNRWLQNGWPILWQVSARAEESGLLMSALSDAVDEVQKVASQAQELEIESVSRVEEWPIWARALFPKLFLALGEAEFSTLILRYEVESSMVSETPWLDFAYLSGFIRMQARRVSPSLDFFKQTSFDSAEVLKLAEQTALEWAHFQALYSPMDENAESLSLEPGELTLNPAAQILPLQERGEVISVVRRRLPSWRTEESVLDWMEAALIDELHESPRLSREQLLATVSFEMEAADHLPGPMGGSWREKLDSLLAKQIVLSTSPGIVAKS